jgi:hypothetical protein
MPTWKDVIRLRSKLPETEVSTWHGTPSLKVSGRSIVRLRTEAEGGLVVLCDLETKEALLESGDPAFYTTPHYDGYGAIIVNLKKVDKMQLKALIHEAWRMKASARLRKTFDPTGSRQAPVRPRQRP